MSKAKIVTYLATSTYFTPIMMKVSDEALSKSERYLVQDSADKQRCQFVSCFGCSELILVLNSF